LLQGAGCSPTNADGETFLHSSYPISDDRGEERVVDEDVSNYPTSGALGLLAGAGVALLDRTVEHPKTQYSHLKTLVWAPRYKLFRNNLEGVVDRTVNLYFPYYFLFQEVELCPGLDLTRKTSLLIQSMPLCCFLLFLSLLQF